MIGNIIHTFSSKIAIAFISFMLLLLNARFLGPEGVGTIGLIVLGITLFQLVSNLLSGSIIYFNNKLNVSKLIVLCYIWSILTILFFLVVNQIYPVFEEKYTIDIYILASIHSFTNIHSSLLLGNERVQQFNYLALLKASTLLIGIALQFYLFENFTVSAFITTSYFSYIITYLVSIIYSHSLFTSAIKNTFKHVFKTAFHYSFYIQLSNSFQLLNYRLSYYILDAFSGRSALGIYSGGVQVSEALILPGRSIATVQYARISRKKTECMHKGFLLYF